VRINLQVIDAMGDNGDCQYEHLSRKLAQEKNEQLGNLVIEKLKGLQIHDTFPRFQLLNYQITKFL
jgi:hypothetical protein